jgi:hypothetical protein
MCETSYRLDTLPSRATVFNFGGPRSSGGEFERVRFGISLGEPNSLVMGK